MRNKSDTTTVLNQVDDRDQKKNNKRERERERY